MSTRVINQTQSLKRRIRRFYELLNHRDYLRCYEMIDPRIRANSKSVTLHQYETSLAKFLDEVGSIEILDFSIELHLDEPNRLYEGRDFAIGRTTWREKCGSRHVFHERWVREGRNWYSRCSGFTLPRQASKDAQTV